MDPFCYMSFMFVFVVTVLSVLSTLVVTCCERAGLYVLLCVMFFVFLSPSHMVSWVSCGT